MGSDKAKDILRQLNAAKTNVKAGDAVPAKPQSAGTPDPIVDGAPAVAKSTGKTGDVSGYEATIASSVTPAPRPSTDDILRQLREQNSQVAKPPIEAAKPGEVAQPREAQTKPNVQPPATPGGTVSGIEMGDAKAPEPVQQRDDKTHVDVDHNQFTASYPVLYNKVNSFLKTLLEKGLAERGVTELEVELIVRPDSTVESRVHSPKEEELNRWLRDAINAQLPDTVANPPKDPMGVVYAFTLPSFLKTNAPWLTSALDSAVYGCADDLVKKGILLVKIPIIIKRQDAGGDIRIGEIYPPQAKDIIMGSVIEELKKVLALPSHQETGEQGLGIMPPKFYDFEWVYEARIDPAKHRKNPKVKQPFVIPRINPPAPAPEARPAEAPPAPVPQPPASVTQPPAPSGPAQGTVEPSAGSEKEAPKLSDIVQQRPSRLHTYFQRTETGRYVFRVFELDQATGESFELSTIELEKDGPGRRMIVDGVEAEANVSENGDATLLLNKTQVKKMPAEALHPRASIDEKEPQVHEGEPAEFSPKQAGKITNGQIAGAAIVGVTATAALVALLPEPLRYVVNYIPYMNDLIIPNNVTILGHTIDANALLYGAMALTAAGNGLLIALGISRKRKEGETK